MATPTAKTPKIDKRLTGEYIPIEELLELEKKDKEPTPPVVTSPPPVDLEQIVEDRPELEAGFQYLEEPGLYSKAPLGHVDPITLKTSSRVRYTDDQRKKINDSKEDPEVVYSEYISRMTNEQRKRMKDVDPEEIDKDYLNEGLGLINYWLSPFMLPQSASWTAAAYVAQALPNPGSYLGDLAESSFASIFPYVSGHPLISAKNALTPDSVDQPKDIQAEDDLEKELDLVSRNIYSRVATGKLSEDIMSGSSYEGTLVSDVLGEVPLARGAEVLDSLISMEEAKRISDLAKKAGNQDVSDYYGLLSNQLVREGIGLLGELILDPLWFLGAAKGTKLITVGGEQLSLSGDGLKALDALVTAGKSPDEAANILVGSLRRDESSMQSLKKAIEQEKKLEQKHSQNAQDVQQQLQNPEKILDNAKADIEAQQKKIDDALELVKNVSDQKEKSQLMLDAAYLSELQKTKLMEAKKIASIKTTEDATRYMTNVGNQEASLAGMYKKNVAEMSRMLDDGYDASKVMDTAGAFRFHVPFTSKTYNPIQTQFKIKPLADIDTAETIALRTVGNVDDLARLNKTTEEGLTAMIKSGQRITVGVGGGGIKALIPDTIISKLQTVTDPLQPLKINNIKSKVINAAGSTKDLTDGERLVYMFTEQGIPGFTGLTKIPGYLMQQLSTFIGTRYFQPWYANREAESAMQYFRLRGVDRNKISAFIGTKGRTLIRLQKTAPKLWDDYQSALVAYNSALAMSSQDILQRITRLSEIAEDIAKARIATGKAVEGTTGIKILDEAARYREKGIAFPPELKGLLADMRGLIDDIDKNTKVEEEQIKQALQNIARFATGDPKAFQDISDQIKKLQTELKDVIDATIVKQRVDIANLKEIRKGLLTQKLPVPYAVKKPKKFYEKQIKDLIQQEKKLQDVLNNYRKATKPMSTDTNFTGVLKNSLESIRAKRIQIEELRQAQNIAQPRLVAERFKMGKNKHYTRNLSDWEIELFSRVKELQGDFSEEQFLTAILGVFKRSKGETIDYKKLSEQFRGTKGLEITKVLPDKYPTVIGQRFEDVPEDIKPLVEELSFLLDTYKELFKQNGFDFIKSPTDMMKIFGVMEHVPHLKYNKATDVKAHVSGKFSQEETKITGGTDALLSQSLSMDSAKFRSLTGTIDEINELVRYKGDQWEFTVDPNLLHSRLMQNSKGIASKEMLLTFLRTGVARVFPSFEEARGAGFVPLLERSVSGLDKEVLLFGSAEQLINAAGGKQDPVPFLDMLQRLGQERSAIEQLKDGGKLKDGPLISWAQEYKEFANASHVEQSVGIIRSVQAKAKSGIPELEKFLIDGEVLDVQKRFQQIGDAKHEAYIQKKQDSLDKLTAKIQKNNENGRTTSTRDNSRFESLKLEVDDASDVYAVQEARVRNTAWKDVSKEINELLSDINKGEYPELKGLKDVLIDHQRYRTGMEPVTANDLKAFFNPTDPIARVYIPESVQESLRMMTSLTFVGQKGTVANKIFNKIRFWNNFWKTRMTIISAMFTARNMTGNTVTNILDVGVGGALNPATNIKAGKLAVLVEYYSKYGSLEKATDALMLPRKVGESRKDHFLRKVKGKELKYFWKGMGSTLDLGDGRLRTWDEALDLMQREGVMSGSANYRLDYESRAEELLDAQHRLSMAEVEGLKRRKAAKVASKLEDATIIAVSAAATGGVPIAMTKNFGEVLARRAENQGRAVNFIANLKRGGTVDDAVANVNKFLLDYNDLTPRQKDYMRVLNPFFTWNFKNFNLTVDMMTKNPLFFSTMNRAFYHTLPMVSAIIEEEKNTGTGNAGQYDFVRKKITDEVKYYPDYKMYRIRLDSTFLPGELPEGYDIEGLGLPVESWAEYMQVIEDLLKDPKVGATNKDRIEGVMARTHWILRAFYVYFENRDPFYREDLSDPKMRDATDVANAVHTLRQFPLLTPLTNAFMESAGITTVTYDNGTNYFFDEQSTAFQLLKYTPNPIARILREGAPIQDFSNRSLMTPEGRYDSNSTPERVSMTWRLLNSFFGFKLKQQASSDYLNQKHEEQSNELIQDKAASLGLSFKQEKTKVRK